MTLRTLISVCGKARAALALTVIVAGSNQALAQNSRYGVFSYGNKTCGQFLQGVTEYNRYGRVAGSPDSTKSPEYASYMNYMWGFLAGSNYFDSEHNAAGIQSEVSANSLFVQNWCRAHPLDTFQTALEYLRVELIRKGL